MRVQRAQGVDQREAQVRGREGARLGDLEGHARQLRARKEAVADLDAFLRAYPGVDFPFATDRKLACPPLGATGSGDLVRRLGHAIDGVAGSHEVVAVPYGTDASTIAEAGIPAVVFGPNAGRWASASQSPR